jgi:hypothetical protein
VLAILGDVVTFQFHYPRNHILFSAPLTNPAADFERVAVEWSQGNYVRIAIIVAATVLVLTSLIRITRQQAQS